MGTNHGTDRTSPTFIKKVGILIGFIIEVVTAILLNMTEDQLQYHIMQKKHIRKQVLSMFEIVDNFVEEKEQWRKFYQKYFSLELNFADVVIPERPLEGNWKLLIIAQWLTLNQVYKSMSAAFECWKYGDDLDKVVTKNTRVAGQAYAVWVCDGVEPDEKNLAKSIKQVDPYMTVGETLLERMIHELEYFDKTGNHLDTRGATLCSGSRRSTGDVPGMLWSGSEVLVYWYNLDHSDRGDGVREAVSI